VVERDGGKPVAGVAILSKSGRQGGPESRGKTDAQGHCSVPVPPVAIESPHFAVHAWKDGFVPVRILWGYNREFEFEGVPAAYTVVLDRGVPIGGIVRDEQGRPVAGARVFPSITGSRESEIERLELPLDTSFTTDDQGRWRCAILPASCETGEMTFRFEHPRFLSSGRWDDRRLPIKDLRALTADMVLQTGYTLSGTVTDRNGRPIEGAAVICPGGGDGDTQLRAKSGPDGRFRLGNLPPGISMVTAEAPGLAPSMRTIRLGPPDSPPLRPLPPVRIAVPAPAVPLAPGGDPVLPAPVFTADANQATREVPCEPPLAFRLAPGRVIEGRIVDVNGRPIAGASLTAEVPTSLTSGAWVGGGWQSRTGADGRFRWPNATLEKVALSVYDPAESRSVFHEIPPAAQGGEVIVTMPAPFRLRGKVVDAETGRPIERFRLIKGSVYLRASFPGDAEPEANGPPDWNHEPAEMVSGGRYETGFVDDAADTPLGYPLLVIRIEAEGYAPAVSRRYRDDEGEQTCGFALRKHPWIKGIVRAPDGSPAAGAEVVVAAKGGPVPWIYNGRLAKGWPGDVVRTGPDGRFAFAKPDQGGRIVIVGDRGLAQRTPDELAAAPGVTLEPWARIRGRLRVGTGVGARRIVGARITEADYRGQPAVPFNARVLTDAEGRFVLDRVAPGHAMVYLTHWFSNGTMMRSHRQGVDVASGQTAEVILGGAGRPVIGRVTRAAGLPSFDLESARGHLKLQQPAPEFPEGFDDWDADRQRAWWFAFYETEEGRKYYERANGYVVDVRSDGSFRLDDVPEGRYRLKLEYVESPAWPDSPEATNASVKLAVLEMYFDVPAGPDEKPLDLGTLTLAPPEPEAIDR
jgi:hypothetical protein